MVDLSAIQELIDYCQDVEDQRAYDGEGHWDTWQSDEFSGLIAKAQEALWRISPVVNNETEGDDAEDTG